MKVDCLTATHGRYTVLKEAITCFIQQDYKDKELTVLNTHEVPIVCNLPQVTIINQPGDMPLGACRNMMLNITHGELVRTWDDDDLYMPWAISQGVEYLNGYVAWKPKYGWSWRVDRNEITLSGNKYEASWTVRRETMERYGYIMIAGGNEHNAIEGGLQRDYGGIQKGNVKPSYVYRWGTGLCRISGSLNKNDLSEDTTRKRTDRWLSLNDDHGDAKPIETVDLSKYWEMFDSEWEKVKHNVMD